MKIGIPRAGLYYNFYPFWKTFLEELGFEIVLSPATDKKILEMGLKTANSEACLPIKIFYGHINWLRENGINTLLLPQMDTVKSDTSVFGKRSYLCPYFVAMADTMKAEYPEVETLRPIMSLTNRTIDAQPWLEFATGLGKSQEEAKSAYDKAQKAQDDFNRKMQKEKLTPVEILDSVNFENKGERTIALIGHPYIIYDLHASLELVQKIIDRGFAVKTMEMITDKEKEKATKNVEVQCHNHWWMTNDQRLAVAVAASDEKISGIIYVTPFNCGPDFMMELYALKSARKLKPITSISIDEASGEAGLNTRIEAFIDVLK